MIDRTTRAPTLEGGSERFSRDKKIQRCSTCSVRFVFSPNFFCRRFKFYLCYLYLFTH